MARTAPADVGREVPLTPAPVLRPLTWAGAERALSLLVALDAEGAPAGPVTVAACVGPEPPAFAVAAPRAFVRAACADGDPGAAIALRLPPDALAVAARVVAAALVGAVREADREAAEYGARRAASLEGAYRSAYADWRTTGGPSGRAPRPLPVALASEGPLAWSAVEDWPLGRLLRFAEDAAVGSFLDELDRTIEEAHQTLRGHHG